MAVLHAVHLSAAFLSESVEATVALGRELGEHLSAGDVVALRGELGAGKTVFVKGVAAGLGIDPDAVTSPSFTLVHEYRDARGRWCLVHVDLYRIDHPDAVLSLGWDEVVGGRRVAIVEWADRAGGWLPAERLDIRLAVTGETARRIEVTAWGDRPRAQLQALQGAPGWGSCRLPA